MWSKTSSQSVTRSGRFTIRACAGRRPKRPGRFRACRRKRPNRAHALRGSEARPRAAPARPPGSSDPPHRLETAPVGQKILVVEDNELNLKLFCDLLRAHSYQAEPVRDGREAVERARAFAPDLIVMDIQMPHILSLI